MTVVNLSDKKGRREKFVLQPSVMLVDDRTCSKFTSNFHKKEEIVKEAYNYGGVINLHQYQNWLMSDNAFLKARELFQKK